MRRAPVPLRVSWVLWVSWVSWVSWVLCVLCAVGAGTPPPPEWVPQCSGAVRCERPRPSQPCCALEPSSLDYGFYIYGDLLNIKYFPGTELSLTCSGNVSLDSPALPRFGREQRADWLRLEACAPPARPLAAVLAALGVEPAPARLVLALPAAARLRAPLLAGLAALRRLKLSGGASLEGAAEFFAQIPLLERLVVENFSLRSTDLEHLPPALRRLHLTQTGGGRAVTLPAALPVNLTHLSVRDEVSVTFDMSTVPRLQWLLLSAWNESAPLPLAACGRLRELHLSGAVRALPARWLAGCPRLRVLRLSRARLREPPPLLLAGAAALSNLSLADCALAALPPALLHHAPGLQELVLANNSLTRLPRSFFSKSQALRLVDLADNRLQSWAALGETGLAALPALGELRLHGNPLGPACAAHGRSPLAGARALRRLGLKGSGATRVCRDWRELPALRDLQLYDNHVAALTFEDLNFNRSQASAVYLLGNPIESISITAEEYRLLLERKPDNNVTVCVDSKLRCDCNMYYAVRALQEGILPAKFESEKLSCSSGEPLLAVRPAELACAVRAGCPARCRCTRGAAWLRLHCAHAGLPALPAIPALPALPTLPALPGPPALHLMLLNNSITSLTADVLPPNLKVLDLRNNSVSRFSVETVRAMVAGERVVLLAGNPLRCDCRDDAALAELQRHRRHVADYAALRCPDGRPLAPRGCDWTPAALAAGVALALALLVLAAAHPGPRRRLKQLLGFVVADFDRDSDDDRPYDAFISYSHADERIAEEIVSKLESGPRPYRVCVHHRDWVPGEWIPAQICSSVRAARRTVALVSAPALRSGWVRAELSAALAQRRLLLVLLLPPAAVTDPALRAHLAAHTYVRWGDPWFWTKLRRALPRPRPPAPAPASPPASPAASPPASPLPRPRAPQREPPRLNLTSSRRYFAETPLSDVKLLSVSYYQHERPLTPPIL